ncbi:hypothetical protein [Streptomyces ipomoeae]|uniref:hypothetical protein n=1 Tax=Streptomyces ipomoeae TaxID=103232 RepID=UPI001146BB1B|nr:hypothetical protein [Streptomyces ipomoeae]TQE25087.1 hypothetical protein Sipo7851_35390 [Streptomyces ipomoeae]
MHHDLPHPPHLPDEGLVRRVKALACTAPLQALDQRKASLDWADAKVYHMAEIALHTIDQVTIAMDFDAGAEHAKVLEQVKHFVEAQAPDRDDAEHAAVADWVLQRLINVGTIERGFSWHYGLVGDEGTYDRFEFDFKLLVEQSTPDGFSLRATDEAINVLVGALDTDVESAQIAAEVKLDNLIRRGRLADAKLAAEQARYRTVQYGETLRRYLDATRRDVRTVDWERVVPDLLLDALEHIEGRYSAEHAILTNITAARDDSDDPRHKQRAAELVEIVRDCIRRHMQLQKAVQEAGDQFRSEQDRQLFSGEPQRAALHLHGQLLVPLLGLPVGKALGPVYDFFRGAVGPAPPEVLTLPSLVERLLQRPSEPERFAGEVRDPQFDPVPEQELFTPEHFRLASEILSLPGGSASLSDLLARARRHEPQVARLVMHRAAHAFNPSVGDAVREHVPEVLIAVPTGDPMHSPQFGGDELWLTKAGVRPVVPGSEEPGTARHEEFGDEISLHG